MDSVADQKKYVQEKLRQELRRRLGKKVQRAAKRYDGDGHSKDIGLRLLLLAAIIMATKALPPQTNIRPMTDIVV